MAGVEKDFVLLKKVKIMSEQNHPQKNPEIVSEPTMEAYTNIARLKTFIIRYVQESEDQELLQEINKLLQNEKKEGRTLNLSRHIEEIFKQYPETLSKLAQ
jgi:hypothetical protein